MTALEVWNNEGESPRQEAGRVLCRPRQPPLLEASGAAWTGAEAGGGGGTAGGAAEEQTAAHAHGLPWKPGDTVGGGQEVQAEATASGAVKSRKAALASKRLRQLKYLMTPLVAFNL